jgi:hypothetical protein
MADYQHDPSDERELALAARKQARQLAEVLTAAYVEFRAAAPDVSIDELKASSERSYCKLLGVDVDQIDEDLDYELLERDDFRWDTREDRE